MNGLCFLTNTANDGFYVMALDDKTVGDTSDATGDNSDSEVQLSADELAAELDTCNATLLSQDKLLRHAMKERNELKAHLEQVLKDIEFARSPIGYDETECESCVVQISNLATLQIKYACLIDERYEVKSRPSLLGTCKLWPAL